MIFKHVFDIFFGRSGMHPGSHLGQFLNIFGYSGTPVTWHGGGEGGVQGVSQMWAPSHFKNGFLLFEDDLIRGKQRVDLACAPAAQAQQTVCDKQYLAIR